MNHDKFFYIDCIHENRLKNTNNSIHHTSMVGTSSKLQIIAISRHVPNAGTRKCARLR